MVNLLYFYTSVNQVIQADIFSPDSLTDLFYGCDAVLSALGHRGTGPFQKVTIYTESIKAISEAIRRAKVPQFIAVTSVFTERRCRRNIWSLCNKTTARTIMFLEFMNVWSLFNKTIARSIMCLEFMNIWSLFNKTIARSIMFL